MREIKSKLQKHLRKEQLEQSQNSPGSNAAKSYQPTAEVKGRIDPSEPDVIQQFRIKMGSEKQQYATEKANEANNTVCRDIQRDDSARKVTSLTRT